MRWEVMHALELGASCSLRCEKAYEYLVNFLRVIEDCQSCSVLCFLETSNALDLL